MVSLLLVFAIVERNGAQFNVAVANIATLLLFHGSPSFFLAREAYCRHARWPALTIKNDLDRVFHYAESLEETNNVWDTGFVGQATHFEGNIVAILDYRTKVRSPT